MRLGLRCCSFIAEVAFPLFYGDVCLEVLCAECVCVYTKYVWEEGIRQALSVLVCVLINSAGSNESLMFCLPSLMKHRWWGPCVVYACESVGVNVCAALCMQIKTPKQEGIVWECICCCFFLIMWICESGRKGANDKYYFSEFVGMFGLSVKLMTCICLCYWVCVCLCETPYRLLLASCIPLALVRSNLSVNDALVIQ